MPIQLELLELAFSIDPKATTKVCKKCKVEKPLSSFRLYRRATGDRDSYDSKCKDCSKEQQLIADKLRKTAPPYEGFCWCCGKEDENPVLDHCHDTGVFRGWLCAPCNLGIGTLGDKLEDVLKAAKYLSEAYEKD